MRQISSETLAKSSLYFHWLPSEQMKEGRDDELTCPKSQTWSCIGRTETQSSVPF